MKRHQLIKVTGKKVSLLTQNIFEIIKEVDPSIEAWSEFGMRTKYEHLNIDFYSTDEQLAKIKSKIKDTYEVEVE